MLELPLGSFPPPHPGNHTTWLYPSINTGPDTLRQEASRPLHLTCSLRGTGAQAAHPVAFVASTPMSRATFTKLATAWSMSSGVCTALIWTRMRALPCGTTG